MTTEDTAVRIAMLLSTATNTASLLHNEALLQASNNVDLRSTFLWLVEEMSWLGSAIAHESASSISWPSNAQERLDRLRAVADAWDPGSQPTSEVLSCARDCLGLLVPC